MFRRSRSPLVALWPILTLLAIFPFAQAWSHSQSTGRDSHNSDSDSKHSVFVYETPYGNITYAVTAVEDVGDMYFHIEGPAENSWLGFGIGEKMEASKMWVVYKNSAGTGVTLCSRMSADHVEPMHDPKSGCSMTSGDGITNGIVKQGDKDMFVVNGYCKNINHVSLTSRLTKRESDTSVQGAQKVDFANTQQPFIFAMGPTDRKLQDDRKGADLRRHSLYGQFQVDMTKATVATANDFDEDDLAKVGGWQNMNAKIMGKPSRDMDWFGPVHSILMCGTYIILFPLGVIFLRIVDQVKWHAWMQASGSILLIGGVGIGIYASKEYNHSKNINNLHQILGLAFVGITLIQLGFGLTHHLLFQKQHHSTLFGKIHLYMGPFVLLAGTANGFLGFNFSGGTYHNLMYGIIVGVVFVSLFAALFWARKRKNKKMRRVEDRRLQDESFEAFKHQGGYMGVRDEDEDEDGHMLGQIPREGPPQYHGGAVRGRELV